MQFFIGIVPPKEYSKKITDFQKQWKNNLLPEVVEPHITIKAQGGLSAKANWLREVKKVCKDAKSFKLRLTKPSFFGESVLFLSVQSDEIIDLHKKIVNAIAPEKDLIKKYMELDYYVPHLTLGQLHWGLSSNELIDMAKMAEECLSPYPIIDVNFLRVFQEIEPNKYRKYLDIPLG